MTLSTIALGGCAQPTTERETGRLTVASGATLTSATYWVIAPDGTTTTGTVKVGTSSTVHVIITGFPTGSGYQLLVSGVASDGVTGCTGSTTFSSPAPSSGVAVTLTCAGPPAPGQALVTTNVDTCPVIDGVSVDTASVNVGSSMDLSVTGHDPDNGPKVLTYTWSATSGSLSEDNIATPTFTCTAAGNVTITVVASDGNSACDVSQSFDVSCTEP